MPLKVVPAAEGDAAASIVIEDRAYGPNPITVAVYPGPFPEDDTSRVTAMVEELRADPACRWMKVVDTDLGAKGEQDMVAFCKWYIWEGESSVSPQHWGLGMNPEACELFFGGADRKREERFQGRPHVYLKLLQTDPSHQRRGAAGMLLKWGTEQADRLGLVSYLEATTDGRPLYEKYGFREVDRLTVDLSKWGGPVDAESVLMLRAGLKICM